VISEPQENSAMPEAKPEFLQQRLHSLDAYRGLIMVTLAFSGFGLLGTAVNHIKAKESVPFWEQVKGQFDHVQWTGCCYWDLIQPSFMFMVGVAAAFSFVKRQQTGQSQVKLFAHVVWRSLILVLLGIFLISNSTVSTNWSFVNVLTQIGLGYPFLYLLWGRSFRTQAIAAGLVLLGTWLLYVLYPYSGIDLTTGAAEVGVKKEWAEKYLTGVSPAWHKNANVGHAIDVWFLNLFPLVKPFEFNGGGYQTINFIPSLATMLFGLMTGELLRSSRSSRDKLLILVGAGLGGLALGQLLALTGVCPLVKRIWTPSWAIFSTGWCWLILASLYGVIDVLGYRRWSWVLMVVGVNSIAMYCMEELLKSWTAWTLRTHFGYDIFLHCGPLYEPAVKAILVGLCFWLTCFWMYRQKIFIRI
jgi:heparan-alpha-glucosaminide N-acetyltransferase